MSMLTGRGTLVECVSCGEAIDLGPGVRLGQILDCPNCDALLEVISLSPAKVGWLEDEFFGEDGFEDEFYFEDEFGDDFDEESDYDYEYDDY